MWSRIISFFMSVFMFFCSLFGITLPEKENKDIIEANGQSFSVSLDENGTTGYLWNYKIGDESIVKLEKSEFTSSAPKGVAGAGGTRIFTFRAVASGKTTIVLNYARSWENAPIKTVTVTVEVAEDLTVTTQASE